MAISQTANPDLPLKSIELESMKADYDGLSTVRDALVIKVGTKSAKCDQLKLEVSTLKRELDVLISERYGLVAQLEQSEMVFDEASRVAEARVADHTKLMDEWNSTRHELLSKIKALTDAKQQLARAHTDALNMAERTMADLKEQLEKAECAALGKKEYQQAVDASEAALAAAATSGNKRIIIPTAETGSPHAKQEPHDRNADLVGERKQAAKQRQAANHSSSRPTHPTSGNEKVIPAAETGLPYAKQEPHDARAESVGDIKQAAKQRQAANHSSSRPTHPVLATNEPGHRLRGVSATCLLNVFLPEVEAAGLSVDSNVYEVEHKVLRDKGKSVLCPRDGKQGAAYVDCVPNGQAGEASVMLSYSWAYTVADIVETLLDFCDTSGRNPENTFFWISCLCDNQQ